jgi:hypothetical protein
MAFLLKCYNPAVLLPMVAISNYIAHKICGSRVGAFGEFGLYILCIFIIIVIIDYI